MDRSNEKNYFKGTKERGIPHRIAPLVTALRKSIGKPSVGATLAVARSLCLLLRFRRGRRLPTVVPTDSRSLSCPPIGALPRNRLASSATGSASPISPTARTGFFPHPRQGTRALPYKALRYRARADRVVRPYNHFRRGDPCGRPLIAPLVTLRRGDPCGRPPGLAPHFL